MSASGRNESLKAVNGLVGRLMNQLVAKEDELRRRMASIGKSHDVRKMNKLRDEIEKLKVRLRRAEAVQNGLLSGRL